MKSFSCLTVSKRTGWEWEAIHSVKSQTVQPDYWLILHEHPEGIIFDYSSYKPLQVLKAPEPIRPSNLNRSLNAGLKLIKSEYVIFYQDFIDLPEDCFEKLLDLVNPNTFVTTLTPNYDGTNDSRFTGMNGVRSCRPEEWEANVAIAPMKAFKELGGFDEAYDLGWSWDNVNVAARAAMLGYKFFIDETNRPQLLPHEQTSKLEMPLNAERHERTMQAIKEGHKPLKLNYL